jgi:hypothetical protein
METGYVILKKNGTNRDRAPFTALPISGVAHEYV